MFLIDRSTHYRWDEPETVVMADEIANIVDIVEAWIDTKFRDFAGKFKILAYSMFHCDILDVEGFEWCFTS